MSSYDDSTTPSNDGQTHDEQWRDIPGYEGHYQVSSHGRIKSLKHNKHRILRPASQKGYKMVNLCMNGIQNPCRVHRAVAEAFIGDAKGLEVNHIDLNPSNNHLSNLEYVTRAENVQHAMRAGRGAAKFNADTVLQILELYESGLTVGEIAAKLETHRRQINDVIAGRSWSHVPGATEFSERHSKRTRDKEILGLHCGGMPATEIAKQYRLSVSQVFRAMRNMKRRAGGRHG